MIKLKIPLYDRLVHYVENLEEAQGFVKDPMIRYDGCVYDWVGGAKDKGFLIHIPQTPDIHNIKYMATLHHECIHAANRILLDAGVPVSANEDEALAYLSDYIFQNIYKRILKCQKTSS